MRPHGEPSSFRGGFTHCHLSLRRRHKFELLEARYLLTNLMVSEVHYHPQRASAVELAAGFREPRQFEFVEVTNVSDKTLDLADYRLTKSVVDGVQQGIAFAFSAGQIHSLDPGERAVIAGDSRAFQARYGRDLPLAGTWSGELRDDTSTLRIEFKQETEQQFTYQSDWYPTSNGAGYSLEVVNLGDLDWSSASHWRASGHIHGSPGTETVTGDANGDQRFNNADIQLVMAAGKYGTHEAASFAEGDWNRDGIFDSQDIVVAFIAGTYEWNTDVSVTGRPDLYELKEEELLTTSASSGVLSNDVSGNGRPLVAEVVLKPGFGTLEFSSDGSFQYLPNHDFSGIDSFRYVPSNGSHRGTSTQVELRVSSINDPPHGRDDFYFTHTNTSLEVSASTGLLSNDIDVDTSVHDLTVTLELGPRHGTVEVQANGEFQYTPVPGFYGVDRFTYIVNDGGEESSSAMAIISVNDAQVLVTEFAASVDSSYRDFDNDGSDWIEITNEESVAIDLGGWHLTDDRNELTKWRFPEGITIDAGESLVVVASGKNFVASTGELHTNFRLSSAGEYLGLIHPEGMAIWETNYETLPADTSHGLAHTSTTFSLITGSSPARIHVPVDNAFGQTWTLPSFVDREWSAGTASLGYTVQPKSTIEPGFTARMLKVGGGRRWQLETTRAAQSLFDGTADRADYFITTDVTQTVPQVNFGGVQSVTPAGNFPDAIPYPDGTVFNTMDDFAIQVQADVTIPAGEWTIGFGSSDGGLLRLNGVSFLETFDESGAGEITDGDGEILFNETRRKGWTTGTFEVPAGGLRTKLEGIFFERTAADFFEVAIINGHTSKAANVRDGWMLLGNGVTGWSVQTLSTPPRPDFNQMFRTNVRNVMHQQSASIYSRIPFEVTAANRLDRLELKLAYDDGFIAYVNGVEVARRNSDGVTLAARVNEPRDDNLAITPAVIDISNHIGRLNDGANVLAIHGLNSKSAASGFLLSPELTAVDVHPQNQGFMQPSPGLRNTPGSIGVLNPPQFSVAGGTFFEPFRVTLISDDPRATIRYTLDGRIPTESSPAYTAPIEILASAEVRAKQFREDYLPSPTATAGYLRLNPDLYDFTSDLPLVVFDTLGQSVPPTSSRQFANSIGAVFEVQQTGRSSFAEAPDLISRVGIRQRGSSSSSYPKKPYRIEFREDTSDDDRNVNLLGLPLESDFNLIPGYEFNRSLNRNVVIYDLSNQMDADATKTRYVEVFLNAGRGELSRDDYQGVYPIVETIKVGPNRLDIGELSTQYEQEPLSTGGYIFKFDRPAPGDRGVTVGPSGAMVTVQMVEPSETTLKQRSPQLEYFTEYVTDFVTALVSPDFIHPELGHHYSAWVDVQSVIDHYLLYELWQATDALFFSGHWYKPREDKLRAGPIWDLDRSAASTDGRNIDPRRWHVIDSAPFWWQEFFEDLEFRQAFIDRWADLSHNVLSFENIGKTFDELTSQIAEAQVRNFEQWPEALPRSEGGAYGALDGTWGGEVRHMRLWLETRHEWMRKLFLQAPIFIVSQSPNGEDTRSVVSLDGDLNRDGQIHPTDLALMSLQASQRSTNLDFDLTNDGVVDFEDTLAMAQLFDTVPGDVDVDGDVDRDDASIFFGNLMNPPDHPVTWTDGDADGDGDVDQTDGIIIGAKQGFQRIVSTFYGDAIYYTIDGTDPRLVGGEISPSALRFDGQLEVQGSTTVMARAYQADFNIDERGFIQEVNDAEAWSGLTTLQLSPHPDLPPLRIVSLNYHPSPPTDTELAIDANLEDDDFEFIELANLATTTIDLRSFQISGGVMFDFSTSPQTSVEPGESVLVVSNQNAFETRYGTTYQIAGEYTGRLSNAGELVRLASGDRLVHEFTYSDDWFATTDGQGASLQIVNPTTDNLDSWNSARSWRVIINGRV